MQPIVINQQLFIINVIVEGKKRINVLHLDGLGEEIQSYVLSCFLIGLKVLHQDFSNTNTKFPYPNTIRRVKA